MLRGLIICGVAISGLIFLLDACSQGGDKKTPVSIKAVMNGAMKGGKDSLCTKVASGKASDEEKKRLVAWFTDLVANKCPKGDEKSWKAKTTALLEAAKSGDAQAFRKAAHCQACHDEHK